METTLDGDDALHRRHRKTMSLFDVVNQASLPSHIDHGQHRRSIHYPDDSVALDLSQEHDQLKIGGEGDDGRPGSALGKRFRRTASQVGNALSAVKMTKKKIHRMDHDQNVLKAFEDLVLYKAMKPLFVCMMMSGVFYIKLQGHALFARTRRYCKELTLLQTYCYFVCALLAFNFLRSMLIYDQDRFGFILFYKITWSLSAYESASRVCLALRICGKDKNNIKDLYSKIEEICYPDGIIPYDEPLRKQVRILLLGSLLLILLQCAIMGYSIFMSTSEADKELFDLLILPIPADVHNVGYYKIILVIISIANAAVATLTLLFYSMTCYVMYKEFEYQCRAFAMKIQPDGQFLDDLDRVRLQHQKRCKLVSDMDHLFKFYIANCYMTEVPLICLLMYSVMYSNQTSTQRILGSYFLFWVTFQMMVVSIAAAIVNTQAHSPLNHIHGIKAYAVSEKRQLELDMFMNKLTGTSIGLTAWDMFVIDKPAILTLVGMILTYFFLLVQFQNPMQEGMIFEAVCQCLLQTSNGTDVELLT